MRMKASQLGPGWQKGLAWIARRREPPRQKVHSGSLAAMIDDESYPQPRGATLPRDQQPLAYDHTRGPARRMSALEAAQWLRESAERKGQPWPLT